MTPEAKFKQDFAAALRELFPGCVILKNDSGFQQGVPDWIVLYQDRWAMLELKAHPKAKRQPNQPWFVEELNKMSYAAFVYPENAEDVLYDLQQALQPHRTARVS